MARMAWFKKERKPRTSERVKLEIPADAWEKCDECGHIDIKDRFIRALNVCPNCGHHRRISAQDYVDLLVDEGSWHELDSGLRSTDPLTFESYRDRLVIAVKKAGPLEALRSGFARLDGMPIDLAVMDFNFMGGSMGSVVGEKIARLTRRSAERRIPLIVVSAAGGAGAVHLDPHQPHHRRCVCLLRDAGGRHRRRARGRDRIRRTAGHQADDRAGPP